MRPDELIKLGIPRGVPLQQVLAAMPALASAGITGRSLRGVIEQLVADPTTMLDHPHLGRAAKALVDAPVYKERQSPAPWRIWGEDFEPTAIRQLEDACSLPVSVAGALMPDGHPGYGLPIGGVLATRGAVIPYAVGMDIACRMRMSVLDWPISALDEREAELTEALERETRFGLGAAFGARERRHHAVMDEDWGFTAVVDQQKDQAWAQLGSSGSGNHFAEFGVLTVDQDAAPAGGALDEDAAPVGEDGGPVDDAVSLGLEPGRYLALLSHSGSRGTGARIAQHFSAVAAKQHPELPRRLQNLAWLDLESEDGQAYWAAMSLMGLYAAANHELIHRFVLGHLGAKVVATVENHHNFAWIEVHRGEQVVVHRKGATPAGRDALGVIPGSMGTPGYVVRGLGEPDSLHSASHGAGRRMSRKEATRRFNWDEARDFLEQRQVRLISGGLDEVPMAYKDIDAVMAAQRDLVVPLARFDPRLVKMAPAGRRDRYPKRRHKKRHKGRKKRR